MLVMVTTPVEGLPESLFEQLQEVLVAALASFMNKS
jgi:hypothetical protein